MDLISVIVPVYKVEKYLDRCVESIVNQTYKNLEIILVDDGSPDNCGAMCDKWAEKDSRIKVIHKENGGLSDARNAGMNTATGDLMGFVDSDDYISPDMYQLLYENMLENNSDISACGIELIWEGKDFVQLLTPEVNIVLCKNDAVKAIIEESLLKQPVVSRLYKTSLIKNIKFPFGKHHEDVFWSYKAISKANNVSVFNKACYFYLQRNGSIMNTEYSLKRLDALDAKVERVEYIMENIPELTYLAKKNLWFSCIYSAQMLTRYCKEDIQKTGLEIIKAILYKCPIEIRIGKNIGMKQLVWLVMAKISFKSTYKIRNKLGIGF